MQVTQLYGVRGSASKNFVFGPYIRLGRPTYGFVRDFSHMVLEMMVFGPWFWTQWFFGPWHWMIQHV